MHAYGEAAVALGHPGAFVQPFAGGLAISGGPGSAVSKIAGAGFAGIPSADAFEALERRYRDVGAPIVFELATLGDFAFVRAVEDRGCRLLRVETVLGRAMSRDEGFEPPAQASALGVAIDVVSPEDVATCAVWRRISVDGFCASEAPDGRETAAEIHTRQAVEQAAELSATLRDSRCYLASRGGVPAGVAALRIDEDRIAQFCGASTLIEHRRHGLQTALVYRRLADAVTAGCDLAVVTTEPGSRSQANCQRHGFVPLYARLVLGTSE